MERLQKILSQAGLASRRTAETLIAQGRVTVNGETVTQMGTKADPAADDIRVDGRRVKSAERPRYILLNKPSGYMTTRSDPQRRPTVIDLLGGVREYVYPVGRLDYDTEGLLLLTNDGDLAAKLTHPRHGVERTYEARVAGMPDEDAIDRLRKGIPLDGKRTLPAQVTLLTRGPAKATTGPAKAGHSARGTAARGDRERDGLLKIVIREGRNRQVRRMCEAVGHPVKVLRRTHVGHISDKFLKVGQWRELTNQEVTALKRLSEQEPAPRRSSPGPGGRSPATPRVRRTERIS